MIWERRFSANCTAAPQAVWDVLLDGRRWSYWNPGVEWMWIEGDPLPGTTATIKLARVRQTAFLIQEAIVGQRFALVSRIGPVAQLQLIWTLDGMLDGTCIQGAVAIAGIAAGILLKRSAERVAQALPSHLERLAAYAAQR